MRRDTIKAYIKNCSNIFNLLEPIYEIGSLQTSSDGFTDFRPFFKGKKYVGCDIREGLGVDQIEDVEALSLGNKSVGTIIIVETLEHVKNPIKAMKEIYRVIKEDGIVIMSCPFNFHIHNHPSDYWRYTPDCFNLLLEKFPTRIIGSQGHSLNPHTVFGIGSMKIITNKQFDEFCKNLWKDISEMLSKPSKKFKFINLIFEFPFLKNRFSGVFKNQYIKDLNFKLYQKGKIEKNFKAEYLIG